MAIDVSGMSRRSLLGAALVFAVVLAASLAGILTRPVGFLAAFWPANALLLGLFVRFPALASWRGWAAALAGYAMADLATGGAPALSLWLTAANLAGVATGVALFRRARAEDRALGRPLSVLVLFAILAAAAGVCALVGAGIAPVYFDRPLWSGLAFWFTTELVNGIVVLPVILSARPIPPLSCLLAGGGRARLLRIAPLALLLAALVLGYWVGGMGLLAFPSPALLLCALAYPTFATVLATMLVSIWQLIAVSLGWAGAPAIEIDATTMTDRLSIMLLALGPLTVACVNAARVEATDRLARLATYDTLTGALTRSAFTDQAEAVLAAGKGPLAVVLLDIDHFKRINDDHGHRVGDQALARFAGIVARSLRESDLFGRIGGEEFAVVLAGTGRTNAEAIAARVRCAVEADGCPLPDGGTLRFTVSIGVAHVDHVGGETLDRLIARADAALYGAKRAGRNRIEMA
ncbi:GGDEF domain-containing protein [Acuticoccus kandeliae]|uniref:GGDEF domain-containing protein n=1 Tax=Acuticoccus kandeliae TaxID=2073160 RepID=UPI000D3E9A3A|nr:GGDEF domain-containing protein [Acuticoccus kandeliae]